jgi:hypothetical protein
MSIVIKSQKREGLGKNASRRLEREPRACRSF